MSDVNNKKIYVGNLSWGVNDQVLRDAFAECGEIASAQVAMDRMTGRSRGFAFVEYTTDEAAAAAVERWNGQDLDGRPLRVNIAMPKSAEGAPRRSFGGNRDNNRGGFGGGYNRGGFDRGYDRGGNYGRSY